MEQHRSHCPVNLFAEVFGDKWSLLILRDIIFYKRRHFNVLLRESEEKIASNVLRDRLAMFEKEGLVVKAKGPGDTHKQKLTYSLTQKSIDLMPVLISAIAWSVKYAPVNQARYKSAIDLMNAGPAVMEDFQKVLVKEHVTGL
jgi:DNA-binding HxlR family transcriptional regulator